MRVTTTVFMLELPHRVAEARDEILMRDCVPGADIEAEIDLRSFVSLYSGQNRIDPMDSSVTE
jgi:hypothetical protein